jgi:hypothetical protein
MIGLRSVKSNLDFPVWAGRLGLTVLESSTIGQESANGY